MKGSIYKYRSCNNCMESVTISKKEYVKLKMYEDEKIKEEVKKDMKEILKDLREGNIIEL